jgi:DNA-directed RNA polymerase specialized sigma24 family protein
MEQAARDNFPAFEILASRYVHRLHRSLQRLTGSADAAASLTEESLCAVFSRRKNLPSNSRSSVLFFATASRLLQSWLKAGLRSPLRPAGRFGADWDLDKRSHQVDLALASLEGSDREVLVFSLLEGIPFPDLAAILGRSQSDLRVQADAAYRQFRLALGERFF